MSQGSLAEITNHRFSLKYQTFRQLAAVFISGDKPDKLLQQDQDDIYTCIACLYVRMDVRTYT